MKKKLIIFDLDGTLYNLDDVVPMYYSMEVDFVMKYYDISTYEAEELLNKNGILPYRTENAKSATDFFINSGIPLNCWTKYREDNFNPDCINSDNAAKTEDIRIYSEFANLILMSSNTFKNICKILEKIKIDKNIFDEIVCSDQSPCSEKFSKKESMEKIIKKYNFDVLDTFSIGDRFNTDIDPMLKLGGNGILIKNPLFLKDLAADFQSGLLDNSEKYKIYNGVKNE